MRRWQTGEGPAVHPRADARSSSHPSSRVPRVGKHAAGHQKTARKGRGDALCGDPWQRGRVPPRPCQRGGGGRGGGRCQPWREAGPHPPVAGDAVGSAPALAVRGELVPAANRMGPWVRGVRVTVGWLLGRPWDDTHAEAHTHLSQRLAGCAQTPRSPSTSGCQTPSTCSRTYRLHRT